MAGKTITGYLTSNPLGNLQVGDYMVANRGAGNTGGATYAPTLNMDPSPTLAANLALNNKNVGAATATEIGYLSGVTSAIQTQINTKVTSGGALGTPTSGNLSNCTNYPLAQLTGAGTGVLTALAVNIGSAGAPVLFNGVLGTPSSGTLSSCTGYPLAQLTGAGTGILSALAINTGSAGAPVLFNGALGTPSSGNVSNCSANSTPAANVAAGYGGNMNLTANGFVPLRTSTVTAAGTTTLTASSTQEQEFTGSTTQTVVLPVTNTLPLGRCFTIFNRSSGVVTVQSSGANTLQAMAANTKLIAICISTSGTGTASWTWVYQPSEVGLTGTGSLVQALSPAITTPTITGLTSGSSPATGLIGEINQTSFVTGTSISTGVTTNLVSLSSLAAGNYLLFGVAAYVAASGTVPTTFICGISTANNTLPTPTTWATSAKFGITGSFAATSLQYFSTIPLYVSISSPTTYYFNVFANFTVSTMTVNGGMFAYRIS